MSEEEIKREDSSSEEHEFSHGVLVSNIRRTLNSITPPVSYDSFIYRVPKKLRTVNEAAYTPHVVSIGPLHYGAKALEKMENHKLWYLDEFLNGQRTKQSLENFVSTIKTLESPIRSCYAETFDSLESDEFVQMILVDACFILELFLRKYDYVNGLSLKYIMEILYMPELRFDIKQDLILLENQLPFFVLDKLYNSGFPSGTCNSPSLLELTHCYFSQYNIQNLPIQDLKDIRAIDFTDFLRSFLLQPHEIQDEPNESIRKKLKQYIDLLISFLPHYSKIEASHSAIEGNDAAIPVEPNETEKVYHIYSATELHDAGVIFEVSKSKCFRDIKFSKNGVLTIPRLELYDCTESYIRNLMALEQCRYPVETYICDYVSVMDHLINTEEDVDLLVQKKIIVNWLGDQKSVAILFNKLCTHIARPHEKGYTSLCKDLNEYYDDPKHKWQKILRRDYLSTPWRIASTIAAIILLVLTLTQTICSIISL